ncbi:GNAT family N-acetyltransferase [Pseudactinotalea terrae]|uniref:GNAT family N-acetyltransferase n=1 Tax=Pseudactinotalea terrae TaxID=1743262 RepID=UPI0019D55F08|nr:GNAT family N-acetyltransferase [Pseudactinotalea terrae]
MKPRTAPPTPPPLRPRPPIPHVPREPGVIPEAERAFFVEEFRGVTIVVSLPALTDAGVAAVGRVVSGFEPGDTRFVLVVKDLEDAERLRQEFPAPAAVVTSPTVWEDAGMAGLWLTVADEDRVIVVANPDGVAETAGFLAAGLRASKVVLTDPGGGWGSPPRSFADLEILRLGLLGELTRRGIGNLLPAAEAALRGGAFSVNLCRAEDLELELFTFDGAGTLLTLGGYVTLAQLRVDDLPAVEALVAQGVTDGVLKPRSRAEIARMAVGGLGARVVRTGHLAGVVGLETDLYAGEGVGEVSGLITVSEFSGAGAGGMLLEGLLGHAANLGLRAVFAVTVSSDAATFFAHRGFREVSREELPKAKWRDYDTARLAVARCFWRDVESDR